MGELDWWDERELPITAKVVAFLFALQDRLVSYISPRLAQKIRCSTGIGHFHKWYLGFGSNCFWCAQCEKYPKLQVVVPYREEYRVEDA